MRKNRSFVITYLASMKICATIVLTIILVIFFFCVCVCVCVNDIFDFASEEPWVSLAL